MSGQPRSLTPLAGNLWLARITVALVSIIILAHLVIALLLAGYQIYHDGLIYPGVSVWDIDLSGMTPDEAAAVLNGRFTYPQTTTLTFRDNEQVWPVSVAELGIEFDVERTVQTAYQIGRHPNLGIAIQQQLQAWMTGITVAPVMIYEQPSAERHLASLATQINRPVLDASLVITGTEVIATPSQVGRTVDLQATLINLNLAITKLENGEVPIVVTETYPQIVSAEEAAERVRAILYSDVEIYLPDAAPNDPGPWTASREALAEMIVIERVTSQSDSGQHVYSVQLNEAQLLAFLTPLQEQLVRQPLNARFRFDQSTQQIMPLQPSVTGRSLNIPASIQMINQMAPTTNRRIPLVVDTIDPPAPDTASAVELGITEMIASATTYYYGSGEGRRANIAVAASRFNGILIAPQQEFSFIEHLGEVSAETGFEEAMIIYNGRTIPGVGGGVCQVSTTAFQAAFYAGFPITDRTAHGYWVGYYDSGEGKGMDAAVYEPIVDLRFQNDTPYWLLIQTYVDLPNSTITFQFYSTSDGRTVEKDGPYISNVIAHGPPLYEENSGLSVGEVRQVDYAVDGFDTLVYRRVYRDGILLFEDQFLSRYIPWRTIYQVAPGAVPPGAERVGQD